MTKLLIDADILLYQSAAVCEEAKEVEPGYWTWHVEEQKVLEIGSYNDNLNFHFSETFSGCLDSTNLDLAQSPGVGVLNAIDIIVNIPDEVFLCIVKFHLLFYLSSLHVLSKFTRILTTVKHFTGKALGQT